MKCLITAIGSMAAEAVIQAIIRYPDATVVGCSMHPKDWTAASRLIEHFHQVPSAQDAPAFLSCLLEVCKSEQITHIIPLTDPEVDAVSEGRQLFDEIGVTLCISPQSAIRMMRDKLAIYRCFADHPYIHPIPTAEFRGERNPDFPYPLLAKPRHGRSSEGHVNIADTAASQFWRDQLIEKDYVIQPYMIGDVFVVDVVRQPDGRRSAAMTRRELLRTPNGAGMTVRMQPGHACEVLALEATETLGVHGCVNLEFLVVDGAPLLMDVNPRFSAGVAFSMISGYDMASNHLRCFDCGQIEPSIPPPDRVYARGLVEYSIRY